MIFIITFFYHLILNTKRSGNEYTTVFLLSAMKINLDWFNLNGTHYTLYRHIIQYTFAFFRYFI